MDLNEDHARIVVDNAEAIDESFRCYGCNSLEIDGICYPIIAVFVESDSVVVGRPIENTYH